MKSLLDPKMDFIFKNIFGSEKHPNILISFLNATLRTKYPIIGVKIKNIDLEKGIIEDKFSRLDIKAETNNNEIINIEIQLKNEHDIIRRSLYYWSKIYSEQLGEGQKYSALRRTICINIVNFKYLDTNEFHSCYRLKEVNRNDELTDAEEIHFIEVPKLQNNSNGNDMLIAWTEFLKDPESEKVKSLEMKIKEIKEAKDELIKISNDDVQRMLYEMRVKTLRDEKSALSTAEEKGRVEGMEIGREEGIEIGIAKGEKKKAKEIAKNLLDILDNETIANKTGLTVEEIIKLR